MSAASIWRQPRSIASQFQKASITQAIKNRWQCSQLNEIFPFSIELSSN